MAGFISRLEMQQDIVSTHRLESQEQASSPDIKHSKTQQPLTGWRAKGRYHQQAYDIARHSSHSQAREPRTDTISRLEMH